jgi:hypothetical protein
MEEWRELWFKATEESANLDPFRLGKRSFHGGKGSPSKQGVFYVCSREQISVPRNSLLINQNVQFMRIVKLRKEIKLGLVDANPRELPMGRLKWE